MIDQGHMAKLQHKRICTGIRQWKRELEILRLEIWFRQEELVARMRDDETCILEALYSCRQVNFRPCPVAPPAGNSFPDRVAVLEDRMVQIAKAR
jgi:hypothetical protein